MSGFYLTDKTLPAGDPLIGQMARNNAAFALHFTMSAILIASIVAIGWAIAPAEIIAKAWQ